MNSYFLIVGEASGDVHAAELIQQIQQRDPKARFAGLGGDQMQAAGCHLYRHIRHMAFMGFAAVLANLKEVRRNFQIAHEALLHEQPEVLILIDYPSFNLQMASFCRKHLPQTRIIYYIPPKVWAWKKFRVHRIASLCDQVLGIFPFEPAFYARYGYRCTYVGHPTVEQIDRFVKNQSPTNIQRKKTIAILPGSRPSEIKNCLPKMLEAARRFPEYNIAVCAAPGIEDAFYAPLLHTTETLTRDTYKVLQTSAAAIVNSGTATLETALIGCPQVAVYHVALSGLVALNKWWLIPLFFSVPYFTPVNIITGKELIKECMADDFTVEKVAREVQRLLTDEQYQKEVQVNYRHLFSLLGSQSASATAADIITSKQ